MFFGHFGYEANRRGVHGVGSGVVLRALANPAADRVDVRAALPGDTPDVRFAIGAVIAVASWPYSLYVMGPVNNQIIALAPKDVGAARALVWQWGLLEYGQTVVALASAATFLWAL